MNYYIFFWNCDFHFCFQSVESKHKASLHINQVLEAHILEVYREIEELKSKMQQQGKMLIPENLCTGQW